MEVEGSHSTGRTAWPGYVRGRDARELFARFLDSDPLRLREASAVRLRQTWFLLDPDRLFRRAAAVAAEAIPSEAPPADLSDWVREKIDIAIEQLVRRDQEAEFDHPDQLDDEEMDFPLLTEALMLEPKLVRAASVGFNTLDALPRRAFFELLVEGRPLGEVIETGPWDADGLYAAVHRALAAVGLEVTAEPTGARQGREAR